ncbi:MAG: hypothetical protein ACM3ZT_05020 [Bacillota bacterium]
MALADTQGEAHRGRRGALRTALVLALVALAFYVGIFLIVAWRHP